MQSFKKYEYRLLSILCAVIYLMALWGCDSDYMLPDDDVQLYVVEGWIDNGDNPVVIITKSMPIDTAQHSEKDISSFIVTGAKVKVECEGQLYELTPKVSKRYFPPLIYTNGNLKGEVGKTYNLTIDTSDGTHLTASTSIPEPVPLDEILCTPLSTCDTLYQIKIRFHDNPLQKNYYKVFTQTHNERFAGATGGYYASYYKNTFLSPILSVLNDDVLGSETEVNLTRGFMNYVKDSENFYLRDDEVTVKFATIDEQSFRYWDEFQNQMIFGTNYMFHGVRNNVSTICGGLGSWCGYGATYYKLKIGDNAVE